LGQCRGIIRELGLTPVVSGDTAGAAREVAEANDPTQAAIAPRWLPRSTGWRSCARGEDEEHNTTRFIVLSRDFEQAPRDAGQVVTTFIFNVRNLPARSTRRSAASPPTAST
jgi:prephenate dehydratase